MRNVGGLRLLVRGTCLSSHILMFAVVSLKHFVNGLFCLAISLKGLPRPCQGERETDRDRARERGKVNKRTFGQWAALFPCFYVV